MRNIFRVSKEDDRSAVTPTDAVPEDRAVVPPVAAELPEVVDGGELDIALEDAEIMVDEGNRQDDEATEDIERSERLLEVSDGLEDLACIADEITDMSSTEQALIANSAQMAVAGTDVEPSDIVPALESGFRTGMEEAVTLRQRAADIWKIICATMQRIYEGIMGFFRNLIGTGIVLEARMKKIRAAAANYKPGTESISIGTGGSLISIDGTPVSNGHQLAAGVSALSLVVRWALETRPKELEEMGKELGKAILNLDFLSKDGENAFGEDILTIINKQLTLPGGSYVKDPRWENESLQKGPELLGGMSLYARTTKQGDDTQFPLVIKLERARNSEMILAESSVKPKVVGTVTVAPLSNSELTNVISGVDEIINAITTFDKEKGTRQLDRARKELDTASKQASAEWDRVQGGENKSNVHNQAVMKAALSLNLAFAKWIKEPIAGIMRHAMEVCRVVIALLLKNVAASTKAGTVAGAAKA